MTVNAWTVGVACILLAGEFLTGAEKPSPWVAEKPIVFTDEEAVLVAADPVPGEIPADVTLLTRDGWGNPVPQTLSFQGGKAWIKPLGEGIHRVRAAGNEARFLAINPPGKADLALLRQSLPRQAEKLLKGDPFTILAMGDSVTSTGEYAEMLAMMLRRATGNQSIRVEKRAYAGRSVDASVRRWKQDTEKVHPDLALIMYGLNDQAANVPLPAYIEQYAWLVRQLRETFDADVLFLEPTPHINILSADKQGEFPPASSIFRVAGYAAALRDLGGSLEIPVAPTFDAVWGGGAESLQKQARKLWPLYPPNYHDSYQTLLDKDGKGDTIHLNALGHLQMARAVFETLMGQGNKQSLEFRAWTEWVGGVAQTRVLAKNVSARRQQGECTVYAFAQGDVSWPLGYDLAPGQEAGMSFKWPGMTRPEDLLHEPLRRVFRQPGPYVQILDRVGDGSRVTAIHAPWRPAVFFPAQRHVVEGPEVEVQWQAGSEVRKKMISLPAGQQVGRMPLTERVDLEGKEAFAVAELVFACFGSAFSGEVTVDGDLADWKNAAWVPVGEPVQARGTGGPKDNRRKTSDCYWNWSFAAGADGVYLAFSGTGNPEKDFGTVFFDTREPGLLGTAGPYFWVDIKMAKNGKLAVKAGDSSPVTTGLTGAWKSEEGVIKGELFIPYACLGMEAWPKSGDLGVSIVWKHMPAEGEPTTLMWAEDGHPWNSRWFGVVRRNPSGSLPYRVRVE